MIAPMPALRSRPRSRPAPCRAAAMLLCGLPSLAAAATHDGRSAVASLQTADTKLQVEARPQAPRLASLGGPGGLRLTSATAERLPDHVEVGGAGRSLQWHFDRAASHSDSKEIALAYRSEAPALSLVSRWRVRAPFGPIEHRLEIRNLGVETLWLPLQPSLTFDWAVDRAVPLQRLWIEKGADTPSAAGT
ncbi:MAG TPA: hypothetical protein VGR80_10755, partial [Steroidobacteraceae bacterium]|nr:hypothetical protein [Steroidobacteraceae bacterium]